MTELDTITDFTDYLAKKASFVRSGQLTEAHGEENLLAYYAIRINEDGDHDFVVETGKGPLTIDRQQYARYTRDPRYLAKKSADEVSILWDRFMLDGTSITLDSHEFGPSQERARRTPHGVGAKVHSQIVLGGDCRRLQKGKHTDQFVRVMISPAGSKQNETAFFIFTVKYLDWMEAKGGYENYRVMRSRIAQIYAHGLLERHSYLKRVVGISREPPDQGRGVSEDLVYAEQYEWTDKDRETIRKDCEVAGVLQDVTEYRYQGEEFPEVETDIIERPVPSPSSLHLNRKQRRARRASTRKRKR